MILGKRFGKLTVVKQSGTKLIRGKLKPLWFCKCDCGNTITRHVDALSCIKSCGCLKKEKCGGKPIPGTALRMRMSYYKSHAKKLGVEWKLNEEQFRQLTSSSPCFYTGRKPIKETISPAGEIYKFNGIDRLDSTKGYTLDNCVPCCWEVNKLKGKQEYSKFIDFIKEIAFYTPPKNKAKQFYITTKDSPIQLFYCKKNLKKGNTIVIMQNNIKHFCKKIEFINCSGSFAHKNSTGKAKASGTKAVLNIQEGVVYKIK